MLDGIGVPLLVRRVGAGSQSASVAVGVRPALLHDDDASRMHPLTALADRRKNPVVLLRDYELDRDLPTAYGRVAAVLTGM